MTDPTRARDAPNNWTLTDQVAIILASYGVDDPAAARAVVALVLDEAEKALSDAINTRCAKCGHPRNNHPYRHPFVGGPSVDPVSVVRALIPKGGV